MIINAIIDPPTAPIKTELKVVEGNETVSQKNTFQNITGTLGKQYLKIIWLTDLFILQKWKLHHTKTMQRQCFSSIRSL